MRVIVCDNYEQMSMEGAKIFAAQITLKPNSILGLATGGTPVGLYKNLIKMNKAGEIDFKDVTTFNLDEYYPLSPENPQSYRYFMNEQLFNHINIDKSRTFVPNGMAEDPAAAGKEYDAMVEAAGGVDVQLLGIGQNGHIAFNEPDENLIAGTHLTGLTESTIQANSRFFNDISEVPTKAITMGIGSIMKAKKIVLLANGASKRDAVKALLDDKITTNNPATLLKVHPDFILICDMEAYGE